MEQNEIRNRIKELATKIVNPAQDSVGLEYQIASPESAQRLAAVVDSALNQNGIEGTKGYVRAFRLSVYGWVIEAPEVPSGKMMPFGIVEAMLAQWSDPQISNGWYPRAQCVQDIAEILRLVQIEAGQTELPLQSLESK